MITPNHRWILTTAWLLLYGACAGLPTESAAGPKPGPRFTIESWDTDTEEAALPQNTVITMIQSRDGYLWLGTLKGLVRFDGVRFEVFNENNTPGLNGSGIVYLFEDSRSNLWVGTEGGGVALVRNNGTVTNLNIQCGAGGGKLVAAGEDSTGAVWLYTSDGCLCRYSGGRGVIWRYGAERSDMRSLIADDSGTIWLGTDWRLYGLGPVEAVKPPELPPMRHGSVVSNRLDFLLASQRGGHWRLANGRIQLWRTNTLERDLGPYPWTNTLVSSACEDREGHLIVGTWGDGAYWFDSTGGFARIDRSVGLSENTILSLCVDREGSLWVGTDKGGVNRVKRQVFDVLENSRGQVVKSVSEDASGGLWFGTFGDGLKYWKEGIAGQMGGRQGLANLYVRAVFAGDEGGTWVGTQERGLLLLQSGVFLGPSVPEAVSEVLTQSVAAIHRDRRGSLWVGTKSGLARWDGQNWALFKAPPGKLSLDAVRAIADDSEGNLWIGTEHSGLNCLRDDKVTSYRRQTNGLPSDNVTALCADDDGALWIGTAGSGLARLRRGQWTRFTARDGLAGDSVNYLIEDGRGNLWIGSNVGLMRVPKRSLNDFAEGRTKFISCRVYGNRDGLPTRECSADSQPAACRTRDGRLWFTTVKGLAFIDPAQLTFNTNQPPVVIESVLIEGEEQIASGLRAAPVQTITVAPGKERLEIRYTGLNLASPKQARFQYWLEGHETGWTQAGDRRVAPYTKLPPGRYNFHVTACNEDGVWNETGATLAIVVLPPFWQTGWFLGATVVFLLAAVVAIVHFFSTQKLQRQLETFRQQEAIEKERARIARDIHDQVGASLTQVSLLGDLIEGDKNLPDEVEAHARQISQTARETTRALDEIVWTVNPSNDTLDGLVNYICKNAQDYLAVAGLRYRLDVPGELPDAPIPPEVRHNVFLATKEAVTNVVRHANASVVWIRLRLEPNRFTLEIEDNGRGLAGMDEKATQTRNGLRNMRKRMEDVGGGFSIGPGAEAGTLVRLTAPLGNH